MERIYHTWDKWECYLAGFYENKAPDGMTDEDAEITYCDFLADTDEFGRVLEKVITEWKHSCEHYLTNPNMNRIAWLGQASLAYKFRIPSRYRGGFNLLSEEQQEAADRKAFEYLNKWMASQGYDLLTWEEAQSRTEANLY